MHELKQTWSNDNVEQIQITESSTQYYIFITSSAAIQAALRTKSMIIPRLIPINQGELTNVGNGMSFGAKI